MADKMISIPNPDPGQVALVTSDGTLFAVVHVSKYELANNPAGAISVAMRSMEERLMRARQEGITDQSELRQWTEADVRKTPTGYDLSDEALGEVMRHSFGPEYRDE